MQLLQLWHVFYCKPISVCCRLLTGIDFMNCRMPIIDKFKDMGTVVMGKVESGSIREGDSLVVMPNKVLSDVFFFLSSYFIASLLFS